MKTIILILLIGMGCSPSNKTTIESSSLRNTTTQTSEEDKNITIQDIIVKRNFSKIDEELRFKIKNIEQKNDALMVDVMYSGGCINNHVFELYSTGKTDENGVIDLVLLHKTTGDKCKMLLKRTKVFNIGKLSNKKSFSKFRLNGGTVTSAEKTK